MPEQRQHRHPLGLGMRRMAYDLSLMCAIIFLVMWAMHGQRGDLVATVGCVLLRLLLWDMWLMPPKGGK